MHYPQRFIVCDFDGCPLRKFRSKREAKWFIDDKPDCSIIEDKNIMTKSLSEELEEFTAKYGETEC